MPELSPLPTLRALNALRFWAAAGVFASHLGVLRSLPHVGDVYTILLSRGHAGVTFFFILSGFILSYAYHDRLPTSGASRTVALKKFYVARIARIYPVHLLTLTVAVLLGGFEKFRTYFAEFVITVFLLQHWLPMAPFLSGFNGPSWSLAHEAFFYALFPFLLPLLLNVPRSMCLALVLGMVAGVAGLALLWPSNSKFLFIFFPPMRLAEFMTGIVLFRLHRDRVWTRVPTGHGGTQDTLIEIGCLALIGLTAVSAYFAPQNLANSLLYLPIFAITILVFASERGAISRWISRPWIFHLGEVSYSFYMFHMIILIIVYSYYRILGPYGVAIVSFASTLIVSLLCYNFFEVPMRAKINALLVGSPQSHTMTASAE